MILSCSYEEVTALSHGARAYLEGGFGAHGSVAAPPEQRVRVEALLPRLVGDLSLHTLQEQIEAETAVRTVVEHLREEMDAAVLTAHPAAEEAVSAYFEFAHALAVLARVREIGREMRSVIALLHDGRIDAATARTFHFPD